MNSILLDYIRPVTDEDKDLPQYSHSRLECYINCPYQFDLKYNQKKTSEDTTIALEMGSLCHRVLELKGQMLKDSKPVDYKYLFDVLDKGEEGMLGVKGLKMKYWETFNEADSEGRTYSDKLQIFEQILKTEMQNSDWSVYGLEVPFKFVYENKYVLHGFIDRIDSRINNKGETEYRLIDYKTSKKVFDETKNKTSQQFSIYNMALLLMTGQLAVENIYRFILIDAEQKALSSGWEKRIISKLDKTFGSIEEGYSSKLWKPRYSPLCFYCNYSRTNPEAKAYKNECEYYSKWTPTNKDFSVNKEWNPELNQKTKKAFDW